MLRRKYRPHQETAADLIRNYRYNYGLFMAPGTGKTIVAIRCSKLPALVICRRDDFLTWKIELEAEGYPVKTVRFIEKIDENLYKGSDFPEWTVITYPMLRSPIIQGWLRITKFQTVIADEGHKLKRWDSQQSKAAFWSTRHIPRKMLMTGSAITNSPIDLFSIGMFIDDGKTFGTSEYHFMARYFLKSGPGWYFKKSAKEEIMRKVQHIGFYVHEDDVLTLPPRRDLIKAAPMSYEQRGMYLKALNEWEIELKDGTIIEIDYVITQMAKLRQIASGFVYDQAHVAHWMPSGKLDLLLENLQDIDDIGGKDKIVIWCAATAEILKLQQLTSKFCRSVVFYGDMKPHEREAARLQFRDDGPTKLFIGQVEAGVGMNELVVADTAVYFSNSLKVFARQQSERRIRREGSQIHSAITYYDYVSENSLDLRLARDIRGMMNTAHNILVGLRKGIPLTAVLAMQSDDDNATETP